MRSIKFRGKRIDNGEWVYGSLWIKKRANTAWNNHFIWTLDGEWIEVVPETVGQFIGLHDKNGQDLDWWEDDIIKDERKFTNKKERLFQIVFRQGCSWLKSIQGKVCLTCNSMTPYLNNGFNKIGNIHENPELLAKVEEKQK